MKSGRAKITSEFGVVVLNYNDFKSTVSCVRSLLRCSPKPGYIVVVDNRSPNESLAVLTEEFAQSDNVQVVDSGRNGGYSFGNNVGIRYLRQMGVKHVLIATADTEVVSRELFSILGAAIGPRTGVVGPQIIGPDGFQNPSVANLSIKYILDLIWIQNGLPGMKLRRGTSKLLRGIRSFVKRHNHGTAAGLAKELKGTEPRKVYKLHGAFLCLAGNFLALLNELDERIFMFGEEDLLAWQCLDGGFEQVLVHDALVRHGDDRSIKLTWGNEAQRFVDNETKKSAKVLKEAIDVRRLIRLWWKG